MLLNLRSSLSMKISQYIFSIFIAIMLLGPLATFFTKTHPNPVIIKSPHRQQTLKEVVAQDQAFLKLLAAVPHQDKELLEPLLESYFQRMGYQDFFHEYNFSISDQLSWNLILRQFGEQLTPEQMPMIDEYITKNFGSRQQFLKSVKTQLLTNYVKRSFHDFSTLPSVQFSLDQVHEFLDRRVDIYVFNTQDIKKTLVLPSEDQLQKFFEQHQEDYKTDVLATAQYFPLYAHQFSTDQLDLSALAAELKEQGYTTVDDKLVKDYALYKAFERIEAYAQDAVKKEDLLSYIENQGFSGLNIETIDRANPQQLDALLGQDGFFDFYSAIDDQQKDRWILLPHGDGRFIVQFLEITPARSLTYQEAAATVLTDWMSEESYKQAYAQASLLKDSLVNNTPISIKNYQQVYTVHVQNLFDGQENKDLSNTIKATIGVLYDPRVSAEQSVAIVVDKSEKQVKLVALREMDLKTFDKSESDQPLPTINLAQYVQGVSFEQTLDSLLKKDFGYQIQPGFWKLLENKA
jgi:hypothetical protein